MEKQLKEISKLMSLVLRHDPAYLGINLDENGWTDVKLLIEAIVKKGISVDFDLLRKIVYENDKKRFLFNEDYTRIRAQQGHSIPIDLELRKEVPPAILFHGTAATSLDKILAVGLNKQHRHHVHLSQDIITATAVGARHGKPVVLTIDARAMVEDGFEFYLSGNNVWLVDAVPPKYIRI